MKLLVCLLAFACALAADQVTLKNGDRVTGKIVKKDGGTLTLKSEFLGVVSIPWAQIDTITADEPITVVLPGGQSVQGKIVTRDGRIEIETAGERREATLTDIEALRDAAEQRAYERLLEPGLMQLWAGGATFGLAGTQGNAETLTLTTGFNAARATRTDKTTIYFNAIRASALLAGISATTAQAVRGGWGYSRNITSRVFLNGFNDYEYDRFQTLDLRFVLGGGLGYIVWKSDRGRFDLLGGGAYNREKFGPPPPAVAFVRNSAEAYAGDELTYKLNAVTSLYQNLRVFPNLSNTGEFRLNFDTGANTRLTRWLTWNLAISDRYLSNPVPGRRRNDFLYTTGIGVTFSR